MKFKCTFNFRGLVSVFIALFLTTNVFAENLYFAPGDSCNVAIPITAGMHTATPLLGGGAVFAGATAAKWYAYTPPMDGILNVNSCLGGADTRLAILSGGCGALVVVADNDDACDQGNGDLYASEVNVPVTGGTDYLIYWDDRWDANGFDFTVTLSDLPTDPTCDQPLVSINDNIESYTTGDVDGQAAHWGIWPGAASSGIVSTDFAASGTQSVKIDGSVTGLDALLLLGDPTSGHYVVNWKMYVPTGNNGYFNLQHDMPTTSAGFWAFEVWFENDGEVRILNSGTAEETFATYSPDEWFDVILYIDIDSDEIRMVLGDVAVSATTVSAWTFSDGTITSSGLNSINFYPNDASYVYYIDDVGMSEIPQAGTGQYCYTAVTAIEGTNTVPDIECFGGAYNINDSGFGGYWFEYTATADGMISIASCGGGADTRGWIFDGECHNLRIQGINDDRCDLGNGNEWASYREAAVTDGNTYYILWDDIWEGTGFDFDLTFTAGDLTPGDFCQSAIAVSINEDIFTEDYGEASVAGPVIGNYVASTTPYAGSAWYSFTPSSDAVVNITSCDGTVSDTRLWVYTGNCDAMENLTLVASDDDGCAPASIITEFAVTANTTYYIEWDDELSNDPILWRIEYANAVNYTFNVDMSLETTDPAGVFIAGTFTGWENLAMEDPDENDIWTVTTQVPPDSDLAFRYKNGPDGWETINTTIGDDCTVAGFDDRALNTGMVDSTLSAVCFSYCVSCDIVDIDEITLQESFEIFPNPASDQLYIQFNLPESLDLEVRLLNTLGQVVTSRILNNVNQETINFATDNLPTGTYFIQLTSDEVSVSRKVIIQ